MDASCGGVVKELSMETTSIRGGPNAAEKPQATANSSAARGKPPSRTGATPKLRDQPASWLKRSGSPNSSCLYRRVCPSSSWSGWVSSSSRAAATWDLEGGSRSPACFLSIAVGSSISMA
ncbi:unnamed protein product [Ascophyllum nodosum]